MKKILLIEDRIQRQKLFLEDTGIDFTMYADILDNYIDYKYEELLEQILHDSFSFDKYDIIVSHKSAFDKNNTLVLSKLKNYCKEQHKILILFSGGISANYYDNSEFESLELNSKIFYSQNLKLFLDATKHDVENILMLCYGEDWELNVVSNLLEKTNLFIAQSNENDIAFSDFTKLVDVNKLSHVDYPFYTMDIENGWVYLNEIKKFQSSLLDYFYNHDENKIINNSSSNQSILIHNNNVADITLFSNRIRFSLNEDDIDKYISKEIIETLKNKEFDKIFIKDNLSSNYLELYGLRVAYHVRMSPELKNKRFVPIIIISEFESDILNKFSHEANILFTKNIYLCKNDQEEIQQFQSSNLKNITISEYQEFLSQIQISQPKDYLSHHSIANEWAIYRWAEFLKVDTPSIQKNKATIENMLYFKYLLAKYPLSEKSGIKRAPRKTQSQGKVLYIDDEWNKGWSDIFESYFVKQENITFKTLEQLNKDTKYHELENFLNETVQSYEPDLVILDMRLLQEDHQTNINEKNISGIKILKHIKDNINPGIQVIMLTASGKSKILDEAHKYDILGYIKKDHPQDAITKTKETFEKLKTLIDIGLEKQYLKDIWNLQKEILALDIFSKKQYNQIKIEIESVFEILNSEMKNKFIYAMFAIFKVLEIVVTFYIEERTENKKRFAYWKNSNIKIPIVNRENFIIPIAHEDKNDSTENKIRVILHEKLNLKDKTLHDSISQITKMRNDAIHSKMPTIDENYILDWFKVSKDILAKIGTIGVQKDDIDAPT